MISDKKLQLLLPNSFRIEMTRKYFCSSSLTLDFKKIFILTYTTNFICNQNIWTRHPQGTFTEIILNKEFRLKDNYI